MVFIFNVNFPERRFVRQALQTFFGIGQQTSSKLMARFHLHNTARVGELGQTQILELNAALDGMKIETTLEDKYSKTSRDYVTQVHIAEGGTLWVYQFAARIPGTRSRLRRR